MRLLFFASLLGSCWSVAQAFGPLQSLRAQQMTSYFENSTIAFQYDYIENLGDDRGYTAGRVGFCTGTGDLIQVVRAYCSSKGHAKICDFLPRLEQINAVFLSTGHSNSDVRGLEKFPQAWQLAASDPSFRSVQDALVERLYMTPALRYASSIGIQSALGKAILFDTIVQHGDGGDPDSISSLIKKTLNQSPFSAASEPTWLLGFLKIRRADLLNPTDPASQDVWGESTDRIDKMQNILLHENNLDLRKPVQMAPFISTD